MGFAGASLSNYHWCDPKYVANTHLYESGNIYYYKIKNILLDAEYL